MGRNVSLLAVVAVVLIWSAGCNGPRYSKQDSTSQEIHSLPTAVRVVTPTDGKDVVIGAPLSGTIRASGQVSIAFQVNGLIEEVYVENGDFVSEGQVLATLDERVFRAQLEQAQGANDQAVAAHQMALNGARPEEIAQAKASLVSAEVRRDEVKADLDRANRLFSEGVIARQTLDAAQSGFEQTEQAVTAAKEALSLAMQGPRTEEVEQAAAIVKQTNGSVDLAQTQLDYSTLTAPIDGTIVMRSIEPGMSIQAGIPAIEIANLEQLEIVTELPETFLSDTKLGDTASVTFPAIPDLKTEAEIISIAPNAQMATRGFPVELKLNILDERIAPGMVALVTFSFMETPGGFVIPERAIVDGNIFIVENDKAVKKSIEVLLDFGDQTFVDGIESTDQVIINGQYYIEDGSSVQIVDALSIQELTKLDVE